MSAWLETALGWPHTGNTLGLIGMVLLALPAFYAAQSSKRLHEFEHREPGDKVHPVFRDGRRRTLERLKSRATQWSRLHAFCLYGGYFCLLLSYIVRFSVQD